MEKRKNKIITFSFCCSCFVSKNLLLERRSSICKDWWWWWIQAEQKLFVPRLEVSEELRSLLWKKLHSPNGREKQISKVTSLLLLWLDYKQTRISAINRVESMKNELQPCDWMHQMDFCCCCRWAYYFLSIGIQRERPGCDVASPSPSFLNGHFQRVFWIP